jgi:hypothetical protein
MVDLVRAGRDLDGFAREFEPTAQSVRNRVAASGIKQVAREEKGSAKNEPSLAANSGMMPFHTQV